MKKEQGGRDKKSSAVRSFSQIKARNILPLGLFKRLGIERLIFLAGVGP